MSADAPHRFDLHNHTYWSYDASAPAERYFAMAQARGVSCFAITEHHHTLSAAEIAQAAAKYPEIRVIPAAEFSAVSALGTVDLLCYGLPLNPSGLLQRLIEENIVRQHVAGEAVQQSLQPLGIAYSAEIRRQVLLSYKPAHVLEQTGVTHVGARFQRAYFIEQGWVNSEEEYQELVGRARPPQRAPQWPKVAEVVAAVREVGGLIVLAHPQNYFQGADRERMDALREECDLDGIECAHPRVAPEFTPIYRAYCKEFGLVSTAGSDSHTVADIEERFGEYGRDEEWLEEFLCRLEARGRLVGL